MSNFSIRFPHCSLNLVVMTAYVASQAAQAYGILANFTAKVVTEDGFELFSLSNLNLNQAKSGRIYITSKGEKINSANGERMIYPVTFLPQASDDEAVDMFYNTVGTTILEFIKEAQTRLANRKTNGVGAMLQSELAKLSVPTKQEPVSVDDIPL